MSPHALLDKLSRSKRATGENMMVFEHAEDIATLKKVGINIAVLVGVMLTLIVASVFIG